MEITTVRDTFTPQAYKLAPWQRPQPQLIPRQSDQTVFLVAYLPWRVGGAHEFLLDQTVLLHCTARRASSVRFLRESDCLNYWFQLLRHHHFHQLLEVVSLESGEDLSAQGFHISLPESRLSSAHPSKNIDWCGWRLLFEGYVEQLLRASQ
jgi:hypothetical protein